MTLRRVALTALVLALLAGAIVAFAVTEALKLEPRLVTVRRLDRVFSPVCACRTSVARLALALREGGTIDAAIVDREGEVVRVLANDRERPAGVVRLRWDGRDDGGRLVPDGRYRLRIRLREEERTIVVPTAIRVDTQPPAVVLVSVRPRAFSPKRGGRSDGTTVVYRTSEAGRRALLVDGAAALRPRTVPAGTRSIAWGGKIRARTLPAGRYELVLQVRDRAGNVGASEPVTVRIR